MANRKRKIPLRVDLTEEEKAKIQANADKYSGGNISAYTRKMLLDGMVVNVDYRPIKELSGELGRIGNNINQIARRANETRQISQDEIEQVKRMLNDIWQLQRFTLLKLGFLNQ